MVSVDKKKIGYSIGLVVEEVVSEWGEDYYRIVYAMDKNQNIERSDYISRLQLTPVHKSAKICLDYDEDFAVQPTPQKSVQQRQEIGIMMKQEQMHNTARYSRKSKLQTEIKKCGRVISYKELDKLKKEGFHSLSVINKSVPSKSTFKFHVVNEEQISSQQTSSSQSPRSSRQGGFGLSSQQTSSSQSPRSSRQ